MLVELTLVASLVVSGWASQYAPNVMERVVRTRQAGRTAHDLPLDLSGIDGFVAIVDCDRIGEVVQIRAEGSREWESFLVSDCSGSAKVTDWMVRNGILVELDWPTVVRWNGQKGRGIRVEVKEELEDAIKRNERALEDVRRELLSNSKYQRLLLLEARALELESRLEKVSCE